MIKFIKNYTGDWDVWHNRRIVGEDFETLDEAMEWATDWIKGRNL